MISIAVDPDAPSKTSHVPLQVYSTQITSNRLATQAVAYRRPSAVDGAAMDPIVQKAYFLGLDA